MSQTQTNSTPFELKANSFTLPTLCLLDLDMDLLEEKLEENVNRAPAFFKNAPIVLDLSRLPPQSEIDFPEIIGIMRGLGMVPVGVRGGNEKQYKAARLMELAILNDVKQRKTKQPTKVAKKVPAVAPQQEKAPTMIHYLPIRSGQRVYAQQGDLIVAASVSSGAEIIADGHIHVYGKLRGRAIAGAKGDLSARIFCQGLDAELVSIAGNYRISESIPAQLVGKATQVYLTSDNKLIIEKI